MDFANLPTRWTQIDSKTWARRNEGSQIIFGRPWPRSGRRWMTLAGAELQTLTWTLNRKDLIHAWLRTRLERPIVALRYVSPNDADVSTYTIEDTLEATAWAEGTVLQHHNIEKPLHYLSEGNAHPANDATAALHLFTTENGPSVLAVAVCHGWSGASGAFAILNTALRNLCHTSSEDIVFGEEVARLPVTMHEALDYTRDGFAPSPAALEYAEQLSNELQAFPGSEAFPLPEHDGSQISNALSIKENSIKLSATDSAMLTRGFKRLGFKLGDGMLHVGCVALYRLSHKVMGKPPSPEATALVTIPIGFESFTPGNMMALSGRFALLTGRNVAHAAKSFDEGENIDLRIPDIDGIVQTHKSSLLAIEARDQLGIAQGRIIGALTDAHIKTLLGISLLGQLDGPTAFEGRPVLQHDYSHAGREIKVSQAMLAAACEMQMLAMRMWSFRGELTVRTVANKYILPPAIIDAWHAEIVFMIKRVSQLHS